MLDTSSTAQWVSPPSFLGLSAVGYSPADELHRLARQVTYTPLLLPSAAARGVRILVRRDDQVDAFESGNKRYKLHYNLLSALNEGCRSIASFGGAWSNHLYALAAAGARLGIKTHGVIRGERPPVLSAMLSDVTAMGMQLHFLSRDDYRQRILPDVIQHAYWVPEGGANAWGALGMSAVGRAIAADIPDADVCLPVGTGASLAGIASGLALSGSRARVFGFSVLKGEGGLGKDVLQQIEILSSLTKAQAGTNWSLISGFHCGGYGRKLPPYLKQFMRQVEGVEGRILWDPVYTLKMLWGVDCLLRRDYWPRGKTVVLIHTGGLQGRRGFDLK